VDVPREKLLLSLDTTSSLESLEQTAGKTGAERDLSTNPAGTLLSGVVAIVNVSFFKARIMCKDTNMV